MKLKVLGSGSSGNCYLLENETECLVIEAGVSFMEVKKALDFNVRKIVGVIASHSHGDHAKYVAEYKKSGIHTVSFGEELPEYDAEKMKHYKLGMGKFRIKPFPLVHDVPCYGFYITEPSMGSCIYATDTEYVRWRFKNVNHILVEANYTEADFVQKIDDPKRDHVLTGHMSIETCKSFILANNSPALRNVCLCHLSAENGDAERFKQVIQEVVALDVNVTVAEKGLEVSLNLCPF